MSMRQFFEQRTVPNVWRVSAAALAIAVAFASANIASAQQQPQYRTDPVDEAVRRNAGAALGSVKNPSRYASEKDKVLEYFEKYYLPSMTGTSDADLAGLGDARYNLFKRYLWAATGNEAFQRDLTALTLKQLGSVITAQNPPYHPAVRYNAVLAVGMLDEQYGIENQRPPKPLPQATKALTAIVNMGTTSDRFPPPVVLGALIGLERHARFRDNLEPGALEAMSSALLKLVNQENPIQEMDRATFAWLQLKAAGILAQIGSPGPENAVHDSIIRLVENLRSLDDRASAAALLANLNYENVKLDGAKTTSALFKLANDIGKAESERAEEFEEGRLTGGGAGFGPRGGEFMPMNVGNPDEGRQFPRRHVLMRLVNLRKGLRAAKPAVPEESQAKIDEMLAALEPAIKAAADKETIELDVTAALHKMAGAIQLAAAPPADEEGEEAVQF